MCIYLLVLLIENVWWSFGGLNICRLIFFFCGFNVDGIGIWLWVFVILVLLEFWFINVIYV